MERQLHDKKIHRRKPTGKRWKMYAGFPHPWKLIYDLQETVISLQNEIREQLQQCLRCSTSCV